MLNLEDCCFLSKREDFYLVLNGENGFPHFFHYSSEPGFIEFKNPQSIFLNCQPKTVGEICQISDSTNQVLLLLVDYVTQRRLEIHGILKINETSKDNGSKGVEPRIEDDQYSDGLLVEIIGLDRIRINSSPRYSQKDLALYLDPIMSYIDVLEKEIQCLKGNPS